MMTTIHGISKNLSRNVAQIAFAVLALMAPMAAQQPAPEVGRAIDAVDASIHADVSEQSQNAPTSRQRTVTSSKWAPSRSVDYCQMRECIGAASSSAALANGGRHHERVFDARSTGVVSKIRAKRRHNALVATESELVGSPFKHNSHSTANHIHPRESSQKTAEGASKRRLSYADAQKSGLVTTLGRKRNRKSSIAKNGIK